MLAVGALLSAILVASAILGRLAPQEHPAIEAVRGYLAAVQDGDLGAASEFHAVHMENRQLLTADAVNEDWTVEQVAALKQLNGSETEVEVAVTIADDGRSVSGVYDLSYTEAADAWTILNPFATVLFGSPPLGPLTVNDHVEPEWKQDVAYALYPGVYQFNEIVSPWVEREAPARLVLNDLIRLGQSEDPFTLTDAGEAELQQVIDAHIDECAGSGEFAPSGCPFGAERTMTFDGTSIDDPEWTVVEYPVVTASSVGDVFVVADRQRGLVELSGTITRDDGGTADASIDCAIVDTNLWFAIVGDDMVLMPGTHDAPHGVAGGGLPWITCED